MNERIRQRAAWSVALTGAALFTTDRILKRAFGRPPRRGTSGDPPIGAADVAIPARDGTLLRAWLLGPKSGPTAVVMHGWGGSAADLLPVGELLTGLGLRVLLLDARGHGRSPKISVASMPTFADDVRAAVDWLPAATPVLLVGHSVGAGACLYAAVDNDVVEAVVCLATMADPPAFMASHLRPWLPGPLTRLALRYVEHVIGHRFVQFTPVNSIRRSRAPVLLVHGLGDTTVPVTDIQWLHAQAPERSTLIVVPGAAHSSVSALEQVRPGLVQFLTSAGLLHDVGTTGTSQ